MKKNLVIVMALGLLAIGAGTASAGGSKGAIGVGGESSLGSIALLDFDLRLGGISLNYDAGEFHAGGLVGFADGGGTDDTLFALGGRFYWHIHSTAMADFGLGGSVSLGFIGDGNENTDNPQIMLVEPGFQTRAFIASNVALSFTAGLTLGLIDAEGVAIAAQPNGSAGIHYYFF